MYSTDHFYLSLFVWFGSFTFSFFLHFSFAFQFAIYSANGLRVLCAGIYDFLLFSASYCFFSVYCYFMHICALYAHSHRTHIVHCTSLAVLMSDTMHEYAFCTDAAVANNVVVLFLFSSTLHWFCFLHC